MSEEKDIIEEGAVEGEKTVTETVKSITDVVAETAAEKAGSVTEAVAQTAGKVTDAVAQTAGAAADAAGDAVSTVAEIATDVADNMTSGVVGAVGSAAGAMKGAAEKATGAVEGAVEGVKQVAAEPAGKRKKKWPLVVGVIAAIAVVAGIGMFIWHEQPSFCAAICHAPMDAYLEGYEQEDNAPGSDKYGNAVANTHAMLAVSHKSHDLACLSCHIPSIAQQIHEGTMMITNTYTVVEQVDGTGYGQLERNLSALQENAGHPNDSGKGDEFCLRSGCHDYDRATLAKVQVLEGTMRQPHMWLETPHASAGNMEFACGDCHKSHRASVNTCTACHADAADSMPEGWITFQESQALMKAIG